MKVIKDTMGIEDEDDDRMHWKIKENQNKMNHAE